MGPKKGLPPPSTKEAPKLEFKSLPNYLTYEFLGSNDTLLVTISTSLNNEQNEKLLRTLGNHKRALGWTISDLRGVGLSLCMYHILMEENYKPVVEM